MELESPPVSPNSSNQGEVRRQLSYATPKLTSPVDIGVPFQPIPGFWHDGRLSSKIRRACEIARLHGYDYCWIDSCCIDKTSSSELSEAINSMYSWYGRAAICYAFLADVPPGDIPDSYESVFRKSRWWTRGWTLQELIAPRRLVFLSSDWQTLGSKSSMAGLVEQIARIDRKILTNQLSLDKMSVARRMSWAADRVTTRVEDRAYSLLGIFDLNMPTLYGEGERAFRRLQEEILRRIPDQTLFALNVYPAWPRLPFEGEAVPGYFALKNTAAIHRYTVEVSHSETLFSSSPSSFSLAAAVDTTPENVYLDLLGLSEIPYPDYSPSPYGIRASFPIISLRRCFSSGSVYTSDGTTISDWYLVLLRCYSTSEFQGLGPHLLARVCRVSPSPSAKVDIMTVGSLRASTVTVTPSQRGRSDTATPGGEFTIFTMSADQIRPLHGRIQVRTVYLPHPDRAPPALPPPLDPRPAPGCPLKFALSSYSSAVLRADGYAVEFHEPRRGTASQSDSDPPPGWTYSLVLRRHDRVLQLNIDQVVRPDGDGPKFLSAAAWCFTGTAADAEPHPFPLSTCYEPRPHDGVVYSFGPGGEGGFPLLTLPKETARYEGVVIRLELEEAAPAPSVSESAGDSGSSASRCYYYLHVDVEELDWYVTEQGRGAAVVQQIRALCSPEG
ncbi:hypothetical protein GSI_02052 [Ganoderma sinense ZZ0214-1]|uniref:Uncharacterized protein n=1 Tax=Ganoderma sinense ZZ0214-1 TaxID=1077348 RepID=A0A2G8SNH4_9APHY|nr:hypothetical protein GSI_02052 [Ganoderma sinense ZZ0214-1]